MRTGPRNYLLISIAMTVLCLRAGAQLHFDDDVVIDVWKAGVRSPHTLDDAAFYLSSEKFLSVNVIWTIDKPVISGDHIKGGWQKTFTAGYSAIAVGNRTTSDSLIYETVVI